MRMEFGEFGPGRIVHGEDDLLITHGPEGGGTQAESRTTSRAGQ